MKFSNPLLICVCGWLPLFISLLYSGHVSCFNYDKADLEKDYDAGRSVKGFLKNIPSTILPRINKTKKITFSEMLHKNFLTRRKRESASPRNGGVPATDPLIAACKLVKPPSADPLRCFHCKSNTLKDKEPMCDHRLWKYLKHSEKARLRETCDLEGKFCVKMVEQKLGQRITTRGCFGEGIIGPNGTKLKSRHGCLISSKKKFRTTVCLCDSDFCNSACKTADNWISLFFLAFITVLYMF